MYKCLHTEKENMKRWWNVKGTISSGGKISKRLEYLKNEDLLVDKTVCVVDTKCKQWKYQPKS